MRKGIVRWPREEENGFQPKPKPFPYPVHNNNVSGVEACSPFAATTIPENLSLPIFPLSPAVLPPIEATQPHNRKSIVLGKAQLLYSYTQFQLWELVKLASSSPLMKCINVLLSRGNFHITLTNTNTPP